MDDDGLYPGVPLVTHCPECGHELCGECGTSHRLRQKADGQWEHFDEYEYCCACDARYRIPGVKYR